MRITLKNWKGDHETHDWLTLGTGDIMGSALPSSGEMAEIELLMRDCGGNISRRLCEVADI